MKTKQLVGILVTGAVIIAVGVTGVLSNVVKGKFTDAEEQAGSSFMESLMSTQSKVTLPTEEFIGVINIVGEIAPSTSSSAWSSSSSEYNHDLYLDYIDKMEKSDLNKGILLYVDSPGGTVYESDEMYLKLMEYKEQTGRPIWAYFASQACSGGYYISMAADQIYANRNCWTGSIGVIISLTNYKQLYDKLGIKEIDITSGANKAMGSGGLDLTEEQQEILQSLVDEAYDQFVGIVANGRNMSADTVKPIADGRIYSAQQALDHNLIDGIGSLEEEKAEMTKALSVSSDIKFYEPKNSSTMMQSLFSAVDDVRPKTDTELAVEIVENKGKGVLKYYAD
ncbi:MAG: signal peptide peptidase SppA [Eubacteriales bacterium]|nr:signal peptide peptidase SppA [Eubacteriales bacterium]